MDKTVNTCCEVDHSQHETFERTTGRWDQVGLFLSSLCAIHCLMTPLLVLFLPVLGEFFEDSWVHFAMSLFVVPVGVFAFWSGYNHHKKVWLFLMGTLGLLMVGGASLAPHEALEIYGFDVVTITGSLVLMTAHIVNRRACQCVNHIKK